MKLEVFNTPGQLVQVLVNKFQGAGDFRVSFNASGLPDGVYSYRLRAGSHQLQKKMILNHGYMVWYKNVKILKL